MTKPCPYPRFMTKPCPKRQKQRFLRHTSSKTQCLRDRFLKVPNPGIQKRVLKVINPLEGSNQKKPGEHLRDTETGYRVYTCSRGGWVPGYWVPGYGVRGVVPGTGSCTGYWVLYRVNSLNTGLIASITGK